VAVELRGFPALDSALRFHATMPVDGGLKCRAFILEIFWQMSPEDISNPFTNCGLVECCPHHDHQAYSSQEPCAGCADCTSSNNATVRIFATITSREWISSSRFRAILCQSGRSQSTIERLLQDVYTTGSQGLAGSRGCIPIHLPGLDEAGAG
jgi:hypothetical protein